MKKLQHKFVDYMPRPLEDGIIYVSLRCRIASHNCCCGCGNEVVLNLSPRGWQLTYDGESISLSPSIGNWNFPCRSHYWIIRDTVRWAVSWPSKKTRTVREGGHHTSTAGTSVKEISQPSNKKDIWAKIKGVTKK